MSLFYMQQLLHTSLVAYCTVSGGFFFFFKAKNLNLLKQLINSENDHGDPISVNEEFWMKYTENIITKIVRFSKLEVNKKTLQPDN